jgi:hypothetical protein
MPHATVECAGEVAERLCALVAAVSLPCGRRLTASFGVATLNGQDSAAASAAELLGHADTVMYRAKRAGGNRVHHSPPPLRLRSIADGAPRTSDDRSALIPQETSQAALAADSASG